MDKNTKNSQKQPKIGKNEQKSQKTQKSRFWPFLGVPPRGPPGPKKKASLSNRRICTRNTDSHMVSIQKCHFRPSDFSACARPPKKGRIRAKIKFFFELFWKSSKNTKKSPFLAIFDHFWPFFGFLAILTKNTTFSLKMVKNSLFRSFFNSPSYLPSETTFHTFL